MKRNVDSKFRTVQCLSIKSDKVVVYRSSTGRKLSQRQLDALQSNWRAVDYNGYMSKSTRSKIMSMLTCWADSIVVNHRNFKGVHGSSVRRLRFLTLTLSQHQSILDNEVKRKALMPFIQKLQAMFHVEHYFWRAEAQKNGNIHFHLVIDAFVDKHMVNYQWDLCQYNAGLLSVKPVFCDKYHTASTRIEAIQGTKAVAGYVIKYVTKEDGARKIFGRIWGCSDSLRRLSTPLVEFSNEFAYELTRIENEGKCVVDRNEHTIVFRTSILYDLCWMHSYFREFLESYYQAIYNLLYL